MKQYVFYSKAVLLLLVFLFLLTGCGQEKPPVNTLPPAAYQNANPDNKEEQLSEFGGSSKPLDYEPCEGIHVKAEANAFWDDTVVDFKPIEEDTETIKDIDQLLYENEGVLIFSGFEVDAGLKDDEIIPGQYDVTYDLSSTDIDPSVYEYLKVYRIGDDGSYYELSADVEDNILRFSCNQNSIIVVGGSICLAGLGIIAANDEYNARNLYYIGSGQDVLIHEGKNTFGKWQIEWLSSDLDPKLLQKLKRMRQIEYGYKKEADKYYSDDIYAANNIMYLNRQIFDYTLNKIENDAEHKTMREQIALPDAIKKIDEYIGYSFQYLYQEEKMRMPMHRVPFKFIRDSEKDYLGLANNRTLSSSYIDINLNKLNPQNKNDMYNLLMTLTHELLHICQMRYRLPIDAISDDTRYDEMVAQYMEADALAYFQRKDIIPEGENIDLTRTDYWGNLRLPISGEEDGNVKENIRQDEVINSGYNLGSFLRYLKEKTGKKLNCHQIMKGRSLINNKLSDALGTVFEIDEREFDLDFRNWVMSNRKEIGDMAYGFVTANMYGLKKPIITKKGEKYHIDLIHGNSYFLNMTCFEPENNENQIMILTLDKELSEVFPSANVGTGTDRKVITVGHYFDKLPSYANKYKYLAVQEIQGDSSDQDRNKNAGYTVYVLDKTPKVELKLSEDKLIIQLPKPELIAEDGIADGYIVTVSADSGIKKAKEIKKELFGKATEISRDVLYNGDTDEDVNVEVTLNEFFLEESGNRIMGIESDKAAILVPKMEKAETKPEGNDSQNTGGVNDGSQIPNSGGYWKLKETNVRKAEDEPGNEQILTSIYYTASELVHSQTTVVPKTSYHDSGHANQTASCSQAPNIIIPGKKVIMHVQVTDEHGGDCGLRTVSGSVSYGRPDDNRTDIAYNRGIKFAATKEGAKNSAYLDTIGNWPCPEVEVYHEFDKGNKDGEEIAILFHGASSSTLWIYEWINN
ncbi:MAG: hypothetical protein K6A70_00335 [Erysipelotrichaceae bacterium]|nr:hypothetical protein [Erysipelotrichaceae bacterium]